MLKVILSRRILQLIEIVIRTIRDINKLLLLNPRRNELFIIIVHAVLLRAIFLSLLARRGDVVGLLAPACALA